MGWARPGCLPDQELGSDDQAFVFDGFKVAAFSFALHIHLSSFMALQWNCLIIVQISRKLRMLFSTGPALAPG